MRLSTQGPSTVPAVACRCRASVLVRIDDAGSTHALLEWMSGQRLVYSARRVYGNKPGATCPRSPYERLSGSSVSR